MHPEQIEYAVYIKLQINKSYGFIEFYGCDTNPVRLCIVKKAGFMSPP